MLGRTPGSEGAATKHNTDQEENQSSSVAYLHRIRQLADTGVYHPFLDQPGSIPLLNRATRRLVILGISTITPPRQQLGPRGVGKPVRYSAHAAVALPTALDVRFKAGNPKDWLRHHLLALLSLSPLRLTYTCTHARPQKRDMTMSLCCGEKGAAKRRHRRMATISSSAHRHDRL